MRSHYSHNIRRQLTLLHAAADACHWDHWNLLGRLAQYGLGALPGCSRLHESAPQLAEAARIVGRTAGHRFAAAAIVNIANASCESRPRQSLADAVYYARHCFGPFDREPVVWLEAVALVNAWSHRQPPDSAVRLMPRARDKRVVNLDYAWRAWLAGGILGIHDRDDIIAILRWAPETAGLDQFHADENLVKQIRLYLRRLDASPEDVRRREEFIDAAGNAEPYPDNPNDFGTPEAYADYLRNASMDSALHAVADLIAA